MESNLGQQAPKLNVTNVSSAVFGKDGPALGKESKIGTLSRILRTTRIKVNNVEKVTAVSRDKISRIINILKTQQMTTGEKLPVPKKNEGIGNIGETLVETNRILVEIQNQLAYDFAMQVADQKKEEEDKKKERSRAKLKAEESALEKSRRRISAVIAKTTEKAVSPFKGIFDQIKEFVMTVGAGIAVNAAFDWLSKEENRKKMEDAFTFLKNNWKWIAGVAAGLFLMSPIIGIVSSIVSVAGILFTIGSFIFSLLGAPAFLTLLGIITAAGGLAILADAISKSISGGGQFAAFDEAARQRYLRSNNVAQSGILIDDDGRSVKFEDSLGNKTLMGNVMTEILAKEKGMDPDEYAKLTNMALPSQVKAYLGEDKYNEAIAGVQAYRQAMRDKDVIKKQYFEELDKVAPKGWWDQLGYFRMVNADDAKRDKVRALDEKYSVRLAPLFERLAGTRAMGGPVTAGKPYLVGESGPELFMPRIDGTIVDNTRTERVYQVLASGRRGRMRTITLPPQVIEGPKPEVEMPLGAATKEPKISSSNPMDGSRSMTSEIYGIMV